MKHGIDKAIIKSNITIFDNSKRNMVEPDRDRVANGWQYQDKAFAEYFNFFWNETSSSLNQINPFIIDFADEILQLKSFMVAEGMSASLFDPAQNNWFGKVGEYLSKAIKKEANDRESALQNLQNTVLGKIDEEKNVRVQAVNKLTTDLQAEVKNRTDADSALKTSLEGKITDETNARNQLATTLRQEIATASTEDRKWANLTGRPSVFPTNWDNVAGKPSSFPTTWGSITGKPSTFPPSSHNHDSLYFFNITSIGLAIYMNVDQSNIMNLPSIDELGIVYTIIIYKGYVSNSHNYMSSSKVSFAMPVHGTYRILQSRGSLLISSRNTNSTLIDLNLPKFSPEEDVDKSFWFTSNDNFAMERNEFINNISGVATITMVRLS